MQYQLNQEFKTEKTIQDEKGNLWGYITKKEYQALGEEQKKIYGDFKAKDSQDAQRQLVNANADGGVNSIGLYRYSTNLGWTQAAAGYIPIRVQTEEGVSTGFVRVIKTSVLKPLLAALAVLLAAVAVFLAWYIPNMANKVPGLDQAAVAYHIEGLVNQDPSQIMIPGLGNMQMTAGQTHVEKVLLNPEGNPCYFQFKLVLKDTGETLL